MLLTTSPQHRFLGLREGRQGEDRLVLSVYVAHVARPVAAGDGVGHEALRVGCARYQRLGVPLSDAGLHGHYGSCLFDYTDRLDDYPVNLLDHLVSIVPSDPSLQELRYVSVGVHFQSLSVHDLQNRVLIFFCIESDILCF